MHQQQDRISTRRHWLRAATVATVGVTFATPFPAVADPPSAHAGLSSGSLAGSKSGPEGNAKRLSIVELFTSQGCSSCPPADRVLADLVQRHESDRFPAVGLSFHVDYWNHLGWRDPFSSEFWSQRQKRYAGVLKDRVYTPQMIVNGRNSFVGSRRNQLDAILEQTGEQTPEHQIEMLVERDAQGQIKVAFSVSGEREGRLVNFALVARALTVTAARGENAGRTLTHANVVRDFAIRRLTEPTGELTWIKPKEEDTTYSVIGFVQHAKNAAITAVVEQAIG